MIKTFYINNIILIFDKNNKIILKLLHSKIKQGIQEESINLI